MKALLATQGTTGDVQPFLALGVELRRRGHEVLLAGPPNFAPRAARHGLAFLGLGEAADGAESRRIFSAAYQEPGVLQQVQATLEAPFLHAEASVQALLEAGSGADVLVSIPYQVAGQVAAELLGVRHASVHFSPFGNSRRPKLSALTAPRFNTLRAAFGLPPLDEPLGVGGISPRLALTPVSPALFPRPASWPPTHHVTGFWFLDEPPEPDPALEAFLAAGPPPVVLGFGSLAHTDPAAVTRLLLEAVRLAGVRAVIQSGWSGLGQARLPPEVHVAAFIPHGWLFPRAACVVHGGGAGTTAAALRAGAPSVVVPHWLDQFLWGALLAERGLASASLPFRDLAAQALAEAILEASASPDLREACRDMAARLEQEQGSVAAADLLEALVAGSPAP